MIRQPIQDEGTKDVYLRQYLSTPSRSCTKPASGDKETRTAEKQPTHLSETRQSDNQELITPLSSKVKIEGDARKHWIHLTYSPQMRTETSLKLIKTYPEGPLFWI